VHLRFIMATNDLHAYAEEIDRQINGPSSVRDALTFDDNKIAVNASHLKEEQYDLPISFHVTYATLDNNPESAQWSNRPLKVDAKSELPADYTRGDDGCYYRRILDSVTLDSIQNTTPLRVGLKLNDIPITRKLLLSTKEKGQDVNVILSPGIMQPLLVGQCLYKNPWNSEGIDQMLCDGWGAISKKLVNNSIKAKHARAWSVTEDSPILKYGIGVKLINRETIVPMIDKNTNERFLLLNPSVAQEIHTTIMNQIDNLPFHDPDSITANIVRMDHPKWTHPKIGASVQPHPLLREHHSPEFIGANLTLRYKLWNVGPGTETEYQ
jgi:hypothetical protein